MIPNGQHHYVKMLINGIEVMSQNIISFTLREWIFAQTIEVQCTIMDSGTFTEHFPIYEDTPVELEIHVEGNSKPTFLKLRMNDFEVERTNSGDLINVIQFSALPAIDDYFMTFRSRTFKHSSTTSTIKKTYDNIGVNVDVRAESSDVQDWFQLSVDDYTFVRQLLKRSFVGLEDSPFLYMERDNKVVYTSLKTECGKTSVATLIENSFLGTPDAVLKELQKDEKSKVGYFNPSTYRKNVASSLNKAGGYGAWVSYYDKTKFTNYTVNYQYSPFTTYSNINKMNFGKYGRSDIFSTQHSSVHNNYYLSMVQNEYVKQMFFSDYLQISIPADTDIRLFNRVTVVFPDSLHKQESTVPLIDKTNSGDYIVGGITHNISKDGPYSMILVLFRNGYNTPEKSDYEMKLVKA